MFKNQHHSLISMYIVSIWQHCQLDRPIILLQNETQQPFLVKDVLMSPCPKCLKRNKRTLIQDPSCSNFDKLSGSSVHQRDIKLLNTFNSVFTSREKLLFSYTTAIHNINSRSCDVSLWQWSNSSEYLFQELKKCHSVSNFLKRC